MVSSDFVAVTTVVGTIFFVLMQVVKVSSESALEASIAAVVALVLGAIVGGETQLTLDFAREEYSKEARMVVPIASGILVVVVHVKTQLAMISLEYSLEARIGALVAAILGIVVYAKILQNRYGDNKFDVERAKGEKVFERNQSTIDSDGTCRYKGGRCPKDKWDTVVRVFVDPRITTIPYAAFYRCKRLASIEFHEGLTEIGDAAFQCCTALSAIDLPKGLKTIGFGAFAECSSLSSIRIPEGVSEICDYAFNGCSSLSSIRIPEGLTKIGKHAFNGCSSLSSIRIPDGLTKIGEHAFNGCSSLSRIRIPEGVTETGEAAFKCCTALSAIDLPEGLKIIDDNAFNGCSSLSSIRIPEGVMEIWYNAFKGCTHLAFVEISSKTTIKDGAFKNCKAFETKTYDQKKYALISYHCTGLASRPTKHKRSPRGF